MLGHLLFSLFLFSLDEKIFPFNALNYANLKMSLSVPSRIWPSSLLGWSQRFCDRAVYAVRMARGGMDSLCLPQKNILGLFCQRYLGNGVPGYSSVVKTQCQYSKYIQMTAGQKRLASEMRCSLVAWAALAERRNLAQMFPFWRFKPFTLLLCC